MTFYVLFFKLKYIDVRFIKFRSFYLLKLNNYFE